MLKLKAGEVTMRLARGKQIPKKKQTRKQANEQEKSLEYYRHWGTIDVLAENLGLWACIYTEWLIREMRVRCAGR